MNGRLIDWNIGTLQPRFVWDSMGGAVWSIACNVSGSRIISGCDDGSVRLYDCSDPSNSPILLRTLSGHKQRVLSLAWISENRFISGSADGSIRVWSCGDDSHVALESQIQSARFNRHDVLVWSVAAIDDMTAVSGDSSGRISVWDLRTGTQLQTFREVCLSNFLLSISCFPDVQHSADILTVSFSPKSRSIFASGIDSTVIEWRRPSDDSMFVIASRHRLHTHDVASICSAPVIGSTDYVVVSGGVDTALVIFRCQSSQSASFPAPGPTSSSSNSKSGLQHTPIMYRPRKLFPFAASCTSCQGQSSSLTSVTAINADAYMACIAQHQQLQFVQLSNDARCVARMNLNCRSIDEPSNHSTIDTEGDDFGDIDPSLLDGLDDSDFDDDDLMPRDKRARLEDSSAASAPKPPKKPVQKQYRRAYHTRVANLVSESKRSVPHFHPKPAVSEPSSTTEPSSLPSSVVSISLAKDALACSDARRIRVWSTAVRCPCSHISQVSLVPVSDGKFQCAAFVRSHRHRH